MSVARSRFHMTRVPTCFQLIVFLIKFLVFRAGEPRSGCVSRAACRWSMACLIARPEKLPSNLFRDDATVSFRDVQKRKACSMIKRFKGISVAADLGLRRSRTVEGSRGLRGL